MKMLDLSKYIEPQLISKRFLITLVILHAWLTTPLVSNEVILMIIAFYFGSHVKNKEDVKQWPKPLYIRNPILIFMASISIKPVKKGFVATNHDMNVNAFGVTKEDAFRNLESNIMYFIMGVKNV